MKKRYAILWAAFFLAAFFFLYLPAQSYPFQLDDFPNIVFARVIRYFGYWSVFFETIHQRGRLLTNLSLAFDYWRNNTLSLSAFRYSNYALHLANVCLFFWLLRKQWQFKTVAALFAAALFLLHPLAVDSVVYISGRASLLSCFFLLLALVLLAYEKYWAVFLAFIAGLFSRENMAIFPALFLLLHWGKLSRWVWLFLGIASAFFLYKVPYFVAAAKGFFRIQGEQQVSSYGEFLQLQISQWPTIGKVFFWPPAQSIDHALVWIPLWQQLSLVLVVLAFTGFAFYFLCRKEQFPRLAIPAFFCLWFLVSLLPTNSVFPVIDPMAERHWYYALPPLLAALSYGLFQWTQRSLILVLPALLFFPTQKRISDWQSATALWGQAYERYPQKARVAFNYALALSQETRDRSQALAVLQKSLEQADWESLAYEDFRLTENLYRTYLRWEKKTYSGQDNFWREYFALADLKYSSAAEKRFAALVEKAKNSYYQNLVKILRIELLVLAKKNTLALSAWEEILRGEEDTNPFWVRREDLASLYLAEKKTREAIRQLELLVARYRVYKRFPEQNIRELADLYEAQGDWLRAKDAYGELLKVRNDDIVLREKYLYALARLGLDTERQNKVLTKYKELGRKQDEIVP